MTDLDKLVQVDLIAFREQVLETLRQRHSTMIGIANAVFAGKRNRVGLEVTENGQPGGQYTLYMDGLRVTHAEAGKLDPDLQHPFFGSIRPYAVIEREALERIMADKQILDEPVSAITRYLPDVTIKFFPMTSGR